MRIEVSSSITGRREVEGEVEPEPDADEDESVVIEGGNQGLTVRQCLLGEVDEEDYWRRPGEERVSV